MTSNEIRNIIEKLDVPKETQIFYDIKEITKARYAYITEYWKKNRNKYIGRKLLAIVVPNKLLATDVVYFLDNGVIINGTYVSYSKIEVLRKFELINCENLNKDDYIICSGDNDIIRVLHNHKNALFACEIIEKIVNKINELFDNDKKIKYYLNLYNQMEDEDTNERFFKLILYKKIMDLTQNPILVKNIVAEFGYTEFSWKYMELKKQKEAKINKGILSFMKDYGNQFYKMYEEILFESLPYLDILQVCDQLNGYGAYVVIYHNILIFAANKQIRLSDDLIYKFNLTVSELKNKIDNGIIELPQEDNLSCLSMIKDICDIYSGKIIIPSESETKEYKYNFLKNVEKAKDWLELYTKQAGCDNTVEYEDVMFSLAEIYKYGTDTEPADENKMTECLKMAANHGSVKASKLLAEYYVNGSEESNKWVQLAKENGQKIKDKRSINEKMKEKVGMDINEAAEAIGSVAEIGRSASELVNLIKDSTDAVNGMIINRAMTKAEKKEVARNAEREQLKFEQYLMGQRIENMKETAKNMKKERKAKRDIIKEEKKRI